MDTLFLLGAAIFPMEVTNWLRPLIMIVMCLLGAVSTVAITMQKGNSNNNIGAISGQETETYAGKNKPKSLNSTLKKLTIICMSILIVLAIFYYLTYLQN